jgi:hypothetical protein
MRKKRERGMTLVELLLAITGMAIISAAATFFLSSTLDIEVQGSSRSELYREGLSVMEKMKEEVKRSTYLLIPNAHSPVRPILAISGSINEDNDFYFGDPLFPRIDEDPHDDMIKDWGPGIVGWDDDDDGSIDEPSGSHPDYDDDEDGLENEDWIDGIDNDGDGNIDEDCTIFGYYDHGLYVGLAGIDDDGDGSVDEGLASDTDEDGDRHEDPLNPSIYHLVGGTNTLRLTNPYLAQAVDLSTNVTFFQVTWEAPQRILIELTLTGEDDSNIQFSEYVYLQNTFQKLGKRVR